MFNRPVKVMADFERPFINAVGQFTGGASIICCFFLFVANVRKQAQRHETLLKDAAGQIQEMIQAANRTKRALMMLPCCQRSSSAPPSSTSLLAVGRGTSRTTTTR